MKQRQGTKKKISGSGRLLDEVGEVGVVAERYCGASAVGHGEPHH